MSSNLIPRRKGENDAEFTKRIHSELQKRKKAEFAQAVKKESFSREAKDRPKRKTKGVSISIRGVRRLYA